jgi:hypothetical protein
MTSPISASGHTESTIGIAGGNAAGREPAVPGQRAEALRPGVAARVVDDHVVAATAPDRALVTIR